MLHCGLHALFYIVVMKIIGRNCLSISLGPVLHATVCNQLHAVAVAVAQFCRILKTGLSPVVPKNGKKNRTRLNFGTLYISQPQVRILSAQKVIVSGRATSFKPNID